MTDKHNIKISKPIIERLLKELGDGWEESSCLNDDCASIHYQSKNEFMSIYVPNSEKHIPTEELYSTFTINISDDRYLEFDNIEEVIETGLNFKIIEETWNKPPKLGAALFEENEKINPSEDFDTYNLDAGDDHIEVYQCKATGWHFLYDPTDHIEPFYCCIGRDDGTFRTLEDLVNWARPLYFE